MAEVAVREHFTVTLSSPCMIIFICLYYPRCAYWQNTVEVLPSVTTPVAIVETSCSLLYCAARARRVGHGRYEDDRFQRLSTLASEQEES